MVLPDYCKEYLTVTICKTSLLLQIKLLNSLVYGSPLCIIIYTMESCTVMGTAVICGNRGNTAVLPVKLAVILRGWSCLLRGYRGDVTGYQR